MYVNDDDECSIYSLVIYLNDDYEGSLQLVTKNDVRRWRPKLPRRREA